jgi:hypothetical protein
MSSNPKNTPKNNSSLSNKFHNYIVSKVIDWALSEQVDKGRFSAFKWGPEDQKLLSQIIENPKNAGLNLPIQDSKFKRFFQSIAENGLNTLDVKMFYRYRDRLPLRQLQWEFKKEDFSFGKNKLISKEEIPAGYYMLEVGINTTSFSSQLAFDLQTDGIKKIQVFELKARSHRICKRLIYLENSSKLAANLSEQTQPNNIYHLRLARLTKNFFLSRMFNKIGRQFDIKKNDELHQDEFDVLWGRYDSLFQKNKNPFTEYEYYIKQIENKQIPTRAEQLRNLQLWKIKNR